MNKKLLMGIVVVLVIAAAMGVYFLVAQKSNEPKEIVIGYNADQSASSLAAFGIAGREGFEIAVDEINAKGGILKKKIRAVILDDKADKEISKKNMEQLIFQEKALVVIGPSNSANALYWLDLPQENEVIVIVHIATATEITQRYAQRPRNYIFRISFLDNEQTRLFIAWAIRKTNNGKIAVIYDTTPYGMQGLKDVIDVLARWGKIPVFAKGFNRGTSVEELAKLIASAKEAQAEGICFYAFPDSNADLLKAMEQVKDYKPVVFGSAANAVKLWDLAGPLASKLVFTSPLTADTNERTKELNQKIINKYGASPLVYATASGAYDAVYLLEAAIKKAGKLDRGAVHDALENIENFQGRIYFARPFSRENHEALTARDLILSHWVEGKIVKIDEDVSSLEIR